MNCIMVIPWTRKAESGRIAERWCFPAGPPGVVLPAAQAGHRVLVAGDHEAFHIVDPEHSLLGAGGEEDAPADVDTQSGHGAVPLPVVRSPPMFSPRHVRGPE